MPNVSFMAPGSELELAQQDASRQRALADALRQQSMTPSQGIQAGQMYVAPSWTQGLAKMLQAYTARKVGDKADEDLRTARTSYDTRTQGEVQDFVKNLRGTPAQSFETGGNEMGDGPSTQTVAAQAPDINKAMMTALGSQNPMIQSMGGNILSSQVASDMSQQRLAAALKSFGITMPGAAPAAGAPAGAAPTAQGAPGAPTQGGIPGVSNLAAALLASGDPGLKELGTAAQQAFAESRKPVVNRGFGLGTMGPDGKYIPDQASLDQALALERGKQGITAPMESPVTLKVSGGQEVQLSRPEYAEFQRTQRLPARYGQNPAPAAPVSAAPSGYGTEAGMRGQASGPMGADPKALDREIKATTADLQKPLDPSSKAGLQAHLEDLQKTKDSLGVPGLSQSQQDQINQTRQTAAGKAVDETFAKDYVSFTTGGAADAAKQLAQLKDVTQALKAPKASLTGPFLGSTPDAVKKFTNPQSIAMRERVEEVVQRSLRAILGAQFTEKEGERLIARAYNPNLSESENAVRVGRLYNQLDQALQAKQDAASYFQKNNTLEGWKGKLPSISDFNVEASRAAGGPITAHPDDIQSLLKKYAK